MLRRDTVVGTFAVLLGAFYSVMTAELPRATIGSPLAPLFFPAILGGLMILFGIGVIVVDRKKAAGGDAEKKKAKDPGYGKLVVGTLLLCGAYGLAFEHFGYMVSTLPFLLALLTLINEPKRWKANLIITFVFTLTLWVVFVKGFHITLPTFPQGGLF